MEPSDPTSLMLRFATALAIGLLIGIERGWQERSAPAGSRTAGVRTYALSSLLGALMAEITRLLTSPWPFVLSMVLFVSIFAWFKLREMTSKNNFSVTDVLVAFSSFALGAFAMLGELPVAAAAAVTMASLLAIREQIHGWLSRLTWVELRSALLLAVMTIIVLPVLPAEPLKLYARIDVREIWIFTILTAAISYIGYIAIKVVGPQRGVLIGAILGAIVSSTAVTISYARRSTTSSEGSLFLAGALIAAAISVLRVIVIVALVSPSLLGHIVLAAATGALVFALSGALSLIIGEGSEDLELGLGNPFDVLPLAIFALAYVAILIAGQFASNTLGEAGSLLIASLSGLFDVDASVLSTIGLLGQNTLTLTMAAQAILVAIVANAVARTFCAIFAGTVRFGMIHAGTSLAAIAAGAVAWTIDT